MTDIPPSEGGGGVNRMEGGRRDELGWGPLGDHLLVHPFGS